MKGGGFKCKMVKVADNNIKFCGTFITSLKSDFCKKCAAGRHRCENSECNKTALGFVKLYNDIIELDNNNTITHIYITKCKKHFNIEHNFEELDGLSTELINTAMNSKISDESVAKFFKGDDGDTTPLEGSHLKQMNGLYDMLQLKDHTEHSGYWANASSWSRLGDKIVIVNTDMTEEEIVERSRCDMKTDPQVKLYKYDGTNTLKIINEGDYGAKGNCVEERISVNPHHGSSLILTEDAITTLKGYFDIK